MAAHSSRHSRFATAIRVDAELKWDGGAVCAGDERAGCVLQELGSHAAVFNPGFGIGVDRETVETAGRVEDGASTVSSRRKTWRHAAKYTACVASCSPQTRAGIRHRGPSRADG